MKTEEKIKIAHNENGYCGSCSWHAAFYEHDYTKTEKVGIEEYWDYCQNSEIEDDERITHRGCYIYPEEINNLK